MRFLLPVDVSLAGTIFADKLRWFDTVDSTNTLALEAAQAGEAEGTVFIADAQTSGRGRGGHSWHSESGSGLYFSMLLRPMLSAEDALWLSLAAGAAVHDAIDQQTGMKVDLRWPNDILLNGRKLAGVLTEMHSEAAAVVVGIGVNVNHFTFPDDIAALATSLRIVSGKRYDRFELLGAILRAFDLEYRRILFEAPRATGHYLLARLPEISTWIYGKRVHVPEQGGYQGVTAGLDDRGFLLVDCRGELRRVLSGGVREI